MLFHIPHLLIHTVLQNWLILLEWVRLDSAVCNALDRKTFLNACVRLRWNKLTQYNWKADLLFQWCAVRSIRLSEIYIYKLSSEEISLEQFHNSLTALSVDHLLFGKSDIAAMYLIQLLSICSNITRLHLNGINLLTASQINKLSPKLTTLALHTYSRRLPLLSFNFAEIEGLKIIKVRDFGIATLSLPPHLEYFECSGFPDNRALVSGLSGLKQLKSAYIYNDYTTNWPSREVLAALPVTIVGLGFCGCERIDFVLETFVNLTSLTIQHCGRLTPKMFDSICLLPCIAELTLETRGCALTPILKRLSSKIVCHTMKKVTFDDDFCVSERRMRQRCPNLTFYHRKGYAMSTSGYMCNTEITFSI